jgi:organic radical activating enzyme
MSDIYKNHLANIKVKLNEISPSFCAAKWKQVTIHLQNGHTHSCHHPNTHLIPIEEIKVNPTALHNTQFKKQQRRMMLEGVRPTECDYCWKVEDEAVDSLSDRVYKSASFWSYPYINDIASKPWDDNVDPSYVEVSFGNVCNFKCSYCAPHISSQWMEEIERYGPYPTSDQFNNLDWLKYQNKMPIPNREENPYVDAFWEWWPNMYNSLYHFRITGGEPLLNKNTFKVLDYIIDNPNPNLEVSINTNMNPPDDLFNLFLEKIKIIINEKKLKKFKLFTSAEAHGEQSNYIRFGMNYDKWLTNIHRVFQEIPDIEFTIMSTYNIMSLPTYTNFLKDILHIKRKYRHSEMKHSPMMIDIPYLRFPEHQAIFIMDPEDLHWIKEHMDFMFANLESSDRPYDGFFEFEADKMRRIYEMIQSVLQTENPKLEQQRINFVKFVDEHDLRRGTNFLETFPQMENFYHTCKALIK